VVHHRPNGFSCEFFLVTSKPLQEELYKFHPHKNSGRFCSNRELEEIDSAALFNEEECLLSENQK